MVRSRRDNDGGDYRQLVAWASLLLVILLASRACSPRIVEKVVTQIEYRDRVVHDTARVEVVREVEKIVTLDTVSHLANTYAMSDASVSGGYLSHTLESIPQVIEVPVEIHVTDTIVKEAEIHEVTVEVERPLSRWQSFKIGSFWYICGAVLLLLLWTFRKLILKLL